MEEFKRAAEKKSAAHWKKNEAVAKVAKGVSADIKDFVTVFTYLEKEGGITKRQREGYNVWSDLDGSRAKKRSNFIQEHSLEGLNTERKFSKVKQILNTLGNESIQDRRDVSEKHNAKVREGNVTKGERTYEYRSVHTTSI